MLTYEANYVVMKQVMKQLMSSHKANYVKSGELCYVMKQIMATYKAIC